jgi:hypothetical protein
MEHVDVQQYIESTVLIILIHAGFIILLFLQDVMRYKSVPEILMGVGMIFLLLQMLIITNLIIDFPTDIHHNKRGNLIESVFFWLQIELVSVCSLVFSNVCFLTLRACIRHKVDNSSEKKILYAYFEGGDSIIAIKKHLQMFNSQWVPFLVACLVWTPDFVGVWQIECLRVTTSCAGLLQTLLTFVHWKKGPLRWQLYAPILFQAIYIINYLVLPTINVVTSI